MDSINKTASHLFPTALPVGVIANWVLEVKLEILNIFKVSEAPGEKKRSFSQDRYWTYKSFSFSPLFLLAAHIQVHVFVQVGI